MPLLGGGSNLAVALGTADLAVAFGVLFAIGHRSELGRRLLWAFAGAPAVSGFGCGDRGALLCRRTEKDLTLVGAADLHCHVVGLALRLLIRAEAVFSAVVVMRQGAVAGP